MDLSFRTLASFFQNACSQLCFRFVFSPPGVPNIRPRSTIRLSRTILSVATGLSGADRRYSISRCEFLLVVRVSLIVDRDLYKEVKRQTWPEIRSRAPEEYCAWAAALRNTADFALRTGLTIWAWWGNAKEDVYYPDNISRVFRLFVRLFYFY